MRVSVRASAARFAGAGAGSRALPLSLSFLGSGDGKRKGEGCRCGSHRSASDEVACVGGQGRGSSTFCRSIACGRGRRDAAEFERGRDLLRCEGDAEDDNEEA